MREYTKHQLMVLHRHLTEIGREAEALRQSMDPAELARWKEFLYKVEEVSVDLFLEIWEEVYND